MRKSIQIKKKETIVGLVKIIELKSKNLTLVLSNYGAGIIDIIYKGINVIVRPASLDDYLTSKAYYGKTIGRTSGRLFPPSFKIDNVDYLIENTPGDKLHLHGGKDGFAFKFFDLMSYSNNSEGM